MIWVMQMNRNLTQVLAAGPLIGGRNVVLAAETGSGKTLAYLGPIISQLVEGMHGGRWLFLHTPQNLQH